MAAVDSRPTGPPAADAVAPIFTLLVNMLLAARSFISRKTKSVACPPNCKPKLPPPSAIIDGALHGP